MKRVNQFSASAIVVAAGASRRRSGREWRPRTLSERDVANHGRFVETAFWILLTIDIALGTFVLATPEAAAASTQVTIGIQAGTGGRVATLQCYDPDPFTQHPYRSGIPNPWAPCRITDDSPPDGVTGAHGGMGRPTDFGAGSGSSVSFQNAYLPPQVRGGYFFMEDASSGCFAYSGPQYNGRRTRAWVYYYDGVGLTDMHEVYYGHISQQNLNHWYTWNNYSATSWLWQSYLVNYWFNNGSSGGAPVGSVATLGSSPPYGCATSAHLHQDTGTLHSETWNPYLASEGCLYTGDQSQSPCPPSSGYSWYAGDMAASKITDINYLYLSIH